MKQEQSSSGVVSDRIVELCTSSQSVSSLLAEDPTLSPKEAWERLYGEWKRPKSSKGDLKIDDSTTTFTQSTLSQEDLERVAKCGKWGPTQPSELFLKVRDR
jgi:hypothetical protein